MKERLKKIESYHVPKSVEDRKYINPDLAGKFPHCETISKRMMLTGYIDHGTSGPLHLGYADPLEKGLTDVFVAAAEIGLPTNADVNSGNPIGFGLGPGVSAIIASRTISVIVADTSE